MAPRELELDRLGLRFASRETEARYRDWHAREAMTFMRLTYVSTLLLVVPAALSASWFAAPNAFGEVAGWVLGLMVPILVAGVTSTYWARMQRWWGWTAVLVHSVGGAMFVLLSFDVMRRPDLAMASMVIASFIGCSVLRLHVAQVILAVFPYFALDEILMARSDEPSSTVLAYTSVNVISFAIGVTVAWRIGRTSRESYRAGRTIEAQQEEIERARESELARVNEEVRRQVAERSRELSEALGQLSRGSGPMEPNRTIDGRYRVVRRLGAGGMGAVYEVERLGDRRRLALKTLRGRANPEIMARLAREAQIAAQLSHPNLVPVLDVGLADGVLFLVMPLVPGGSLEQQRSRFGDAAWAGPLLAAIASGLAALHERGILHRDLKPGNILLADGLPQIADFGLSRVSVDPSGDTQASVAHADTAAPLTRSGDLMGTPAYMAPELASGADAASPASDVFAFGVIAYELLRGRAPFTEPVVFARAENRVVKPPVLDGIAAPIARSLELDPTKRPSANEIAAALRC